MEKLNEQDESIARMWQDLAELRLAVDISGRHSGVKKGLFADPMLSNAMRDAGQPQTALIANGALCLPITFTVHQIGQAIKTRQSPAYTHRVALAQNARTGSMLVNPYNAFDPLPRPVTLTPAVDRWTRVRHPGRSHQRGLVVPLRQRRGSAQGNHHRAGIPAPDRRALRPRLRPR